MPKNESDTEQFHRMVDKVRPLVIAFGTDEDLRDFDAIVRTSESAWRQVEVIRRLWHGAADQATDLKVQLLDISALVDQGVTDLAERIRQVIKEGEDT